MPDYSKIVIATANLHKLNEIQQILRGLLVHLLSLQDYPEIPPIIGGPVPIPNGSYRVWLDLDYDLPDMGIPLL